jgi:hypothetical protein
MPIIIRTIKQSDMLRCPHYIMMPDHYRDDGTCRCNDKGHTEMHEWGYMWSGTEWIASPEENEG